MRSVLKTQDKLSLATSKSHVLNDEILQKITQESRQKP